MSERESVCVRETGERERQERERERARERQERERERERGNKKREFEHSVTHSFFWLKLSICQM